MVVSRAGEIHCFLVWSIDLRLGEGAMRIILLRLALACYSLLLASVSFST